MSGSTYYASGTGPDGTQLWVVTASGGSLTETELADLYPATPAVENVGGTYELATAPNNSSPSDFTNFGGGTLFVASGLHTGQELFITDGTPAGTHLVTDLTPTYTVARVRSHGIAYTKYTDVASSEPTEITAVGARLAVFTADVGASSQGLFATDGTAAGTTQITTDGLYQAHYLTAFGTSVLFEGTTSTGAEAGAQGLWITDGTAAGTQELTGPTYVGQPLPGQLEAAASTGFAVVATAAGGEEAFFAGTSAGGGTELWKTDGTEAGTQQVADIAPGAASSSPSYITGFGVGRAIFVADDGSNGPQLWTTDGTQAGTTLVKAIDPGGTAAFQLGFDGFKTATVGGVAEAFFSAFDGTDSDPWVTDGTAAGTVRLLDETNAYAGNFTAFDGKVFFTAYDPSHGRELWVTDGTRAGTTLFDDVDPGTAGSSPTNLHVLGSELVFDATVGDVTSVWETDGTLAGTQVAAGLIAVDPSGVASQAAPCFARGTRVLGPGGPVAVEDVREGDLLLTRSGAAAAAVWIGERRVDCRRHPHPQKVLPVRIRAGAFGPNLPAADVVLSPDHAVLVEDVLIPAGLLVNGETVLRETVASVHYFHIELPLHDILLAEGLPVESFLDTGNRGMFAGQAATALHPDFARCEWEGACAPLVLTGPVLERARLRLAGRRLRQPWPLPGVLPEPAASRAAAAARW